MKKILITTLFVLLNSSIIIPIIAYKIAPRVAHTFSTMQNLNEITITVPILLSSDRSHPLDRDEIPNDVFKVVDEITDLSADTKEKIKDKFMKEYWEKQLGCIHLENGIRISLGAISSYRNDNKIEEQNFKIVLQPKLDPKDVIKENQEMLFVVVFDTKEAITLDNIKIMVNNHLENSTMRLSKQTIRKINEDFATLLGEINVNDLNFNDSLVINDFKINNNIFNFKVILRDETFAKNYQITKEKIDSVFQLEENDFKESNSIFGMNLQGKILGYLPQTNFSDFEQIQITEKVITIFKELDPFKRFSILPKIELTDIFNAGIKVHNYVLFKKDQSSSSEDNQWVTRAVNNIYEDDTKQLSDFIDDEKQNFKITFVHKDSDYLPTKAYDWRITFKKPSSNTKNKL